MKSIPAAQMGELVEFDVSSNCLHGELDGRPSCSCALLWLVCSFPFKIRFSP